MTEWVLLISLCWGCNGRAQSTIDIATKEACVASLKALAGKNHLTFCIKRTTGEVVFGDR